MREFLITGLRTARRFQGRILAADPIGKHKTSWQIATVIFFLLLLPSQEFHATRSEGRWGPGSTLWSYGGWTWSAALPSA